MREGPLGEEDLVRRGARAQPNLQARWDHGLLTRRRPWLHHSLVEQILKLRAAHLVTRGVGIGQVVRDIVYVHFLRRHAAGGAI